MIKSTTLFAAIIAISSVMVLSMPMHGIANSKLPYSMTENHSNISYTSSCGSVPEIGIGTKWTYNNFDLFPLPGSSLTGDIVITGEEIIDDKSYWVLSPLASCGPTATHLRIMDKQYFLRINGEDHMMQDFNLLVGDTYKVPSFFDPLDSLTIMIDSISNTVVDGVALLTQYCSLVGEDDDHYEWYPVFVEHVGPLGYLVPQVGTCDPGSGGLRCITYPDGSVLNFTNGDDCDLFLGYSYMRNGSHWYYGDWSLTTTTNASEIAITRDSISTHGPRQILELLDEDGQAVAGSQVMLYGYDNKVFFDQNGSLMLLFDFSYDLNVGDTVTYYLPANANLYDNSSNGGIEEIKNPYRYVIEGIDEVTDDSGIVLRRWQVTDIPKEIDGELYGNDIRELVEGVGGTTCFMRRGLTQLTAGEPEAFRCYTSTYINYSEVEEDECDIVSTRDVSASYDLYIKPNPVADWLTLETGFDYNQIIIYDMMGRPLLDSNSSSTISVRALPSGTYRLVVQSDEGYLSDTFVKI